MYLITCPKVVGVATVGEWCGDFGLKLMVNTSGNRAFNANIPQINLPLIGVEGTEYWWTISLKINPLTHITHTFIR